MAVAAGVLIAEQLVERCGSRCGSWHRSSAAALREHLPHNWRSAAHARAAEACAAAAAPGRVVAEHLLHVVPGRCRRTLAALRGAADDAATRHAWPDALRYLRRALIVTSDEERPELLLAAGAAAARIGDADAERLLDQASIEATDPATRARTALESAALLGRGGRYQGAVDRLVRARDALGDPASDAEAALLAKVDAVLLSTALMTPAARACAAPLFDVAARRAATLPTARADASRPALAADLLLRGGTAREVVALVASTMANDAEPVGCAGMAPWCLAHADQLDLADEHATTAVDAAASPTERAGLLGIRGIVRYRRGLLAAAQADAEAALEVSTGSPDVIAVSVLVSTLVDRGRPGAARAVLTWRPDRLGIPRPSTTSTCTRRLPGC